ncbi:DUF3307 domain-containing protein [Micromonospora sp. WMMD754]|uniref:DUF3307 domain-containing protein n=1 Tax=Micromonospora sp. WMMD754 TaxID=3404114 RepID=UPI003BF4B5A2
MTGLGIVLAHLVGDYVIQSHWMACEKTKRWWPAVAHGITYTLPYLLVTRSPWALLVIGGTHIVVDRYRLARHVVWVKNQFAPRGQYRPVERTSTGYPLDTPPWMAVWLMIVADNTLHLAINAAAVMWL